MNLTHQLAHEIQAPLLSLELQLRQLLESTPDRDLAENCLQEVAALKHLITHVLELDEAPLTLLPVELAPLIERAAKRFRPIAAQRDVRLSMDTDSVTFLGDAGATERILSNLLDNAIKFSAPGGNVEVLLRASDDGVELEVRDDGIGLADDTRARVFEPFYRVNREAPGAGLGLAISTRLAQAQHATLRCDSELGRGSAFVLALPVASS